MIPTTCAEGGVTLGPPMGRPGAEYGSPEWRERVSAGLRRYHERRRKVAQVAPRDLARLARDGELAPSLRPLLPIAAEEAYELTEALGGLASVSPQRRAIIEDIVAVGIVLRATLARFLQTRDHELGSKVGTLASARRASLQALGLERVAKELDLSTYLAQKAAESAAEVHQTASNEENGGDPDPAGRRHGARRVCAPWRQRAEAGRRSPGSGRRLHLRLRTRPRYAARRPSVSG